MENFFGSWVLEKSENLDEYLKASNVPWMVRKVIPMMSLTKVFSQNPDGTYTVVNKSKKTITMTFQLGITFESTGFDDKKHAVTFEFKDNALYETRVRLEEADQTPDVVKYVVEGDYLVLYMEKGSIKAKRIFKKQ